MLVKRRAFKFDGVRLFGLSEARGALEPSGTPLSFRFTAPYVEALETLGDREVEAVMVLQAHNAAVTCENAMRVGAYRLRRRTGKSTAGTPLTSFRSAMRHASQADRKNVAELRRQLAEHVGSTRPVDPLTPLCAMLRERGKMTAMEIAELLHRLAWASGQAVERMGDSREGARYRIKKRLARSG
jgi:hypothetical protein